MIILFNVIVSWEWVCACMYICDIRHTGFISVIPLRDLWFLFSICWLLLPKRFLYRYVKSFIKYVPLVLSCLFVCSIQTTIEENVPSSYHAWFYDKVYLNISEGAHKNYQTGRKWIQNERNLLDNGINVQ